MIERNEYLEKLIKFKDKDIIKVVTGVRRSGKSTLFKLYIEYLLKNGVSKNNIIHINLEDLENRNLLNYLSLYDHINEIINPDEKFYIFLDEIQTVENFQKAVDSLYIKDNVDLYITGSNAYLLSGELATLLTGRYIEIKMLPLSFKEFFNAPLNRESKLSVDDLYSKYISYGSFPYVLNFEEEDSASDYIKGIFDTIMLKDIVARKKYPDYQMFLSVVYFMLDNISNLSSTNNITNTMNSSGRKLSIHTVESYINSLLETFLFYKISRYDIKGKSFLKTGDKYYVVDLGLRYFTLSKKITSYGSILENVVFLELKRRGYDVYIGKSDDYEVDFVAISNNETIYVQVSETIKDDETLKRELRSLDIIKDHNKKILLTNDKTPIMNHNGIIIMNVLEWLLN